jgi:hypothetical protein
MIVFGIFALTYQGFWYTKQEKVAQIGPMQVTANTEHPVYFPPFLGGLLIAGGIVVLVVGRINKK